MKINSAEFEIGAAFASQFPPPVLPEVAFAGKSNVGKSSLLNTLLQRKKLVKTSATPGKTQQINFFVINGRFRVVDLPGYGYAQAPKATQAGWARLVETYLTRRESLTGVVLIVDARHDPSPLDVQMKDWLESLGRPTLIVAGKVDKLKASQVASQLRRIQEVLRMDALPLAHSSRTGQGREEVWGLLGGWLEPLPAAAGARP